MKKYDIKYNVDEMVLQICKYIKSADLSNDEDVDIKVETALSFLAAAIDFTDKPGENMGYIADQIESISIIIKYMLLKCAKSIIDGNVDESRYL